MQGKTVLITGANQGIGKAAAIALGKMGANLVLVCRNAEKARAAVADVEREGAKSVELLIGDMSSQADIRRVATEFKAKHDRLDVLLNNAGALVPSRRTTVDGIEETFGLNHLGYFLLTNLLLDVLKASAPSRIVSVSSEAHRRAKMRWDDLQFKKGSYSAMGAYGQSKLANILFTRALAAGSPVDADLADDRRRGQQQRQQAPRLHVAVASTQAARSRRSRRSSVATSSAHRAASPRVMHPGSVSLARCALLHESPPLSARRDSTPPLPPRSPRLASKAGGA